MEYKQQQSLNEAIRNVVEGKGKYNVAVFSVIHDSEEIESEEQLEFIPAQSKELSKFVGKNFNPQKWVGKRVPDKIEQGLIRFMFMMKPNERLESVGEYYMVNDDEERALLSHI